MTKNDETLVEDYKVAGTFNNYFNNTVKTLCMWKETHLVYTHANNISNLVLMVTEKCENHRCIRSLNK